MSKFRLPLIVRLKTALNLKVEVIVERVQGVEEPTQTCSDHSAGADGIAMALTMSAEELVEVAQRISGLVEAFAKQRGVEVAV